MHLVYAIDGLGSGGAQRQLVELARRVRLATGWRVSCLVYRDDDFYGARLREAEVPVVRIAKARRIDPLFPRRLAAWLAGERVELVHVFLAIPTLWQLAAGRLLRRSRRPALIAAERDSAIATTARQRLVQTLAYRGADAVTANAEVAARAIVRRLGVPAERVHYLPNGIDLPAWDRAAEAPCPIALEPGRLHVGLIGRLEPQKNHALLIEALRRIEPARRASWQFWCVGAETGGRAFAHGIEAAIDRAGLAGTVRLLPPTPAAAALMRALDLLVLPSRHEGFPNVALEAMASGLLVVASRVGDVPNLLEDGRTGLLFDSEDADGLAHTLLRAAALPPAEREEIRRRARAVVEERYQIDAIAARYVRLYEAVRAAHGPTG